MFGEIDSSSISSPVFDYPVRLCDGCLVSVPWTCTTVPMGAMPATGGECYPFQDRPIDCCDNGAELVCPAPVPMM